MRRGARRWNLAQSLTTDLLLHGAIKPSTEFVVHPLIPLRKMGYGDRIPDLWQRAVDPITKSISYVNDATVADVVSYA